MDNLEKKEMENETYYTNRVELLFETEFAVEREIFKNFFLALLGGERFISLKITSKEHTVRVSKNS